MTNGDLPPSSKLVGVRLGAAAAATSFPVSTEPVNAMPVDARMGRQRGAGLLADALHHVEDAVGHTGVARDVGEHRGGERRPLGRLEDDGVPGGERGRQPPGSQHQRRVPGRDDGGHAGRIHET